MPPIKVLGVHPRIVDITPAHAARSIEPKDPDIWLRYPTGDVEFEDSMHVCMQAIAYMACMQEPRRSCWSSSISACSRPTAAACMCMHACMQDGLPMPISCMLEPSN